MNANIPGLITLSCPSCGAKLEISPGLDRFACAFCGQEHIVKRTNSTVSLSPVIEAIHQVGTGVDKTAAELAIVRLQKEISELQLQRQNLLKESPPPSINILSILSIIIGSIITLSSVTGYLINKQAYVDSIFGGCCTLIGITLLVVGLLPFLVLQRNKRYWEQSVEPCLNALSKQITEKQSKLEQNRKLVRI